VEPADPVVVASVAMPSGRLVAALVVFTLAVAPVAAQPSDTVGSGKARIEVRPIAHGTLALVLGRHVILIDPARFVPGYPEPPRADLQALAKAYLAIHGSPPRPARQDEDPPAELNASAVPVRPDQMARFDGLAQPTVILVTHGHTDHLDPRVIAALRTRESRVVVPASAAGLLLDVKGAEPLANGARITLDGLTIEAVPMYNPAPDPTLGTTFHVRGRGNGYVIAAGGLRAYVAGDTGCTPEMKALQGIDVAFVPMNVPYTMTPEDAAACIKAMQPRIVYPYHYSGSDPAAFAAALAGSGIEVRLRDWYSGATRPLQ
jgi:L-ascorbate metabolism protein UlaG (beta-lactamase superfamily)